jgi:hypothetical protein
MYTAYTTAAYPAFTWGYSEKRDSYTDSSSSTENFANAEDGGGGNTQEHYYTRQRSEANTSYKTENFTLTLSSFEGSSSFSVVRTYSNTRSYQNTNSDADNGGSSSYSASTSLTGKSFETIIISKNWSGGTTTTKSNISSVAYYKDAFGGTSTGTYVSVLTDGGKDSNGDYYTAEAVNRNVTNGGDITTYPPYTYVTEIVSSLPATQATQGSYALRVSSSTTTRLSETALAFTTNSYRYDENYNYETFVSTFATTVPSVHTIDDLTSTYTTRTDYEDTTTFTDSSTYSTLSLMFTDTVSVSSLIISEATSDTTTFKVFSRLQTGENYSDSSFVGATYDLSLRTVRVIYPDEDELMYYNSPFSSLPANRFETVFSDYFVTTESYMELDSIEIVSFSSSDLINSIYFESVTYTISNVLTGNNLHSYTIVKPSRIDDSPNYSSMNTVFRNYLSLGDVTELFRNTRFRLNSFEKVLKSTVGYQDTEYYTITVSQSDFLSMVPSVERSWESFTSTGVSNSTITFSDLTGEFASFYTTQNIVGGRSFGGSSSSAVATATGYNSDGYYSNDSSETFNTYRSETTTINIQSNWQMNKPDYQSGRVRFIGQFYSPNYAPFANYLITPDMFSKSNLDLAVAASAPLNSAYFSDFEWSSVFRGVLMPLGLKGSAKTSDSNYQYIHDGYSFSVTEQLDAEPSDTTIFTSTSIDSWKTVGMDKIYVTSNLAYQYGDRPMSGYHSPIGEATLMFLENAVYQITKQRFGNTEITTSQQEGTGSMIINTDERILVSNQSIMDARPRNSYSQGLATYTKYGSF